MNALDLFLALCAWSWVRFYAGRWRHEIANAYMWRSYYGRGSTAVTWGVAALRALVP